MSARAGNPLIVQRVDAGHDTNGNPRRAWTVWRWEDPAPATTTEAAVARAVRTYTETVTYPDLIAVVPEDSGAVDIDIPGMRSEPGWDQPYIRMPDVLVKPKELRRLLKRGRALGPIL